MEIIKATFLFIIIASGYGAAQVVTAVAPLKPGNKWVYQSTIAGDHSNPETYQYLITDSIQVIIDIPFYVAREGRNLGYANYYGITPNQLFARYDSEISDSLYTYFKIMPQKGDTWEQQWKNGITLHNTIIDTFVTQVFGNSITIYTVDRLTIENGDTSTFGGSREYWTKEYGMLNGLYEQAEDILKGCVIDGVLYGDTTITGIEEVNMLPDKFVLYQNYPNPFNPNTVISWELATGSKVRLEIYNILGEKLKILIDKYYNSGKYSLTFNAEDLPSGIYFYRLISEDFIQTKKMILLR